MIIFNTLLEELIIKSVSMESFIKFDSISYRVKLTERNFEFKFFLKTMEYITSNYFLIIYIVCFKIEKLIPLHKVLFIFWASKPTLYSYFQRQVLFLMSVWIKKKRYPIFTIFFVPVSGFIVWSSWSFCRYKIIELTFVEWEILGPYNSLRKLNW